MADVTPARRQLLRARLALVLGSLVLSWAALEAAAWIALRGTAPVRLRDGVYVNRLPLVNGRPGGRFSEKVSGQPLERRKAEGELRVAVFGESSVAGAPWGYVASPATMLHDVLRAALPPERPLTVLNMGHTSSFVMDAYYYLLATAKYAPDYVVFYQGMNDRFDLDAEMCFPARRPLAYAVWRWLVAHSNLLYATRVLGPERLGLLRASANQDRVHEPLCHDDSLEVWTDLLVREARALGTQVVVVTPVRSALDGLDVAHSHGTAALSAPEALARAGGSYRRILECLLTPACDLPALLRDEGLTTEPSLHDIAVCALTPGCGVRERVDALDQPRSMLEIAGRGGMWRRSAQRQGASLVDFYEVLRSAVPGGVFAPPAVVDEVHLSLDGYALWARVVGQHVLAAESGSEVPLPTLDLQRYRDDLDDAEALILTELALLKLATNKFAIAAALLRTAAETRHGGAHEEALGWMRRTLGISSDAGSGALEAADRAFDANALREKVRAERLRLAQPGRSSPRL